MPELSEFEKKLVKDVTKLLDNERMYPDLMEEREKMYLSEYFESWCTGDEEEDQALREQLVTSYTWDNDGTTHEIPLCDWTFQMKQFENDCCVYYRLPHDDKRVLMISGVYNSWGDNSWDSYATIAELVPVEHYDFKVIEE